jgi:hypothetical protein
LLNARSNACRPYSAFISAELAGHVDEPLRLLGIVGRWPALARHAAILSTAASQQRPPEPNGQRMARRIAVVVGIVWMTLVVALGAWLGLREWAGAPGLFFKGGYGEAYLLAALFFPGFALHRWGKR